LSCDVIRQTLADILETAGNALDIRVLVQRLENPRLYVAWAAVFLLHVAFIWMLTVGIVAPSGALKSGVEVQMVLVAPGPLMPPKSDPVPEPQMQAPEASDDPPPDIEIQASAPMAASGLSPAAILPPRPDPVFHNASPPAPETFAQMANGVQAMLTVLVAADGSVSDARVAQSSGQSVLDQLAIAFAKAHWRFRAAMQNGTPIADWTTVLVRFAPPG
jgi:TonB family protein